MDNTKTEPHNTEEGYCCACDFDMIELKEREAAAFKRGWNCATDVIAKAMDKGRFLEEAWEMLEAAYKALPDEAADNAGEKVYALTDTEVRAVVNFIDGYIEQTTKHPDADCAFVLKRIKERILLTNLMK